MLIASAPKYVKIRSAEDLSHMQALRPYVTSILGVDVSPAMVESYNAAACVASDHEAPMRAVVGDLLAEDQAVLEGEEWYEFDLCVMSVALHHVQNPEVMVSKLVERVKVGGRVVIVDWVDDGRGWNDPGNVHGGGGSDGHVHGHAHEGEEVGHKSGSDIARDHAISHAIFSDGFSKERMGEIFGQAGCGNFDFVLALNPSEMPHGEGKKQLFFAKGTKL